jgi:hypothetical protein
LRPHANGRTIVLQARDDHHMLRELDHRTNDRLSVWLLWHTTEDRLIVAVAEETTGVRFQIDVRNGERALDVFHHPYAYAAWRGIDTRSNGAYLAA